MVTGVTVVNRQGWASHNPWQHPSGFGAARLAFRGTAGFADGCGQMGRMGIKRVSLSGWVDQCGPQRSYR